MRKTLLLALLFLLIIVPLAMGADLQINHYMGLAGRISYSDGLIIGVEPFYFIGDVIIGGLKAGCAAAFNFKTFKFLFIPNVNIFAFFFSLGIEAPIAVSKDPVFYLTPKAGLTLLNQVMLDFGFHILAPEEVKRFHCSLSVSPSTYTF